MTDIPRLQQDIRERPEEPPRMPLWQFIAYWLYGVTAAVMLVLNPVIAFCMFLLAAGVWCAWAVAESKK